MVGFFAVYCLVDDTNIQSLKSLCNDHCYAKPTLNEKSKNNSGLYNAKPKLNQKSKKKSFEIEREN